MSRERAVLPIEERVAARLKELQLTITTAESCTGGLVSGRLVNVAGISENLKEAYVTYCDEAKQKLLGVKPETLASYTAVSEETAAEMAEGGAWAAGADVCVSVTGVAGPDGGSEKFPVGLVYIGCYCCGTVQVRRYVFPGNRMEVRTQAVDAALEFLLERLQ